MSKLRTILVVAAALVMLVSLPGDRSFAKKAGGGGSVTLNVTGNATGTASGSTISLTVSGGGGGGGGGNPSWSQTLSGSGRFSSVLGGAGTVDNETGLVWETLPGATVDTATDWFGAQSFCTGLNLENRMGWRVPTVQELASLLDATQINFTDFSTPTLPPGHPFTTIEPVAYWAATADSANNGWFVDFGIAVPNADVKGQSFGVWCVRTGSGSDLQG
jgi:hypothetical protein